MPSLFYIRKRFAGPLAWLMVLAMLSPLSPHLAEGVALCIGESHVGVEATGAAHHSDDGRATSLAPANAEGTASMLPGHTPGALLAFTGAPEAPSPNECSDIPLRLVKTGDACYQAVQASGEPDVPPLLVSQTARFTRAGPSAPNDDYGAHERRSLRATPSSSPLANSTVVLLI